MYKCTCVKLFYQTSVSIMRAKTSYQQSSIVIIHPFYTLILISELPLNIINHSIGTTEIFLSSRFTAYNTPIKLE